MVGPNMSGLERVHCTIIFNTGIIIIFESESRITSYVRQNNFHINPQKTKVLLVEHQPISFNDIIIVHVTKLQL